MRQIDALRKELEAIEDVDRADFDALRQLGFGTDARGALPTDLGAVGPEENARSPASDGAAEPESSSAQESAPEH